MAQESRGSIASLTTAVSLGLVVFFSLYSLVPVTRADDPAMGSLFVGTMMAFVMGVQVFTPLMVRTISLRGVMVVSTTLLALGAFITGWAEVTSVLLTGAVIAGAAFGTLIVAGAQGVALLASPARLGPALGTYGMITLAASAIGSPAGVQLAITFSPRVFGTSALVIGLLAAGCSFGIPAGVGKQQEDRADQTDAPHTPRAGRGRASVLKTPWIVLVMLLFTVVLLSFGLTTLPVFGVSTGFAALVVFSVQGGNAIGRWIGGRLEATYTSGTVTRLAGALLAIGGILGVLQLGTLAALIAGLLVGLGVGIVQTVSLHIAVLRMGAGAGSVAWNLAVDGGLWTGGVLWGVALTTGTVWILAPAFAIAVLGIALLWRPQRKPPKRRS